MGRLKNRVAIVTGAGSIGPGWGNGKAIATLFAREGAKVFGIDINRDAVDETATINSDEGNVFTPHVADVTNARGVEEAVAACIDRYGELDILVNNVGVVRLGGPVELPVETWYQAFDINVTSAYLTCKFALPHLEKSGRGSIINISSIAGIRATGVNYSSYYTTKSAMLGLSRGIALEYARRGVRSNCILPGLMDTPLVYADVATAYDSVKDRDRIRAVREEICPMGRMGDAWDVAHASLFLASDEAKYVTGTELVVDGGISARCA